MQVEEHSLQHTTLGSYLILATASLVVQLVVALPITLRTWNQASRPDSLSFYRADAIAIAIFLVLQSLIGAFFLWSMRRSNNYLLHAGKGVVVVLCSFLIVTPLAYILLRFSYKPLPSMPPSFFFMLIFFLGHRIPLLGVVLSGFVAATVQWLRP